MRPLSYWHRELEMREYALAIDNGGASRAQVLAALTDKFGNMAPTDESRITDLRMRAARGEWSADPRRSDKAPMREKPHRQRLYPRHWRYWEAQPGIRELAIRMIAQENHLIQQAIEDRFGSKHTPTEEQIILLRNRITTRNQWVDAIKEPDNTKGEPLPTKTISPAAQMMFSNEQVTGCQIPGITLLTRLQCLKHQLNLRLTRSDSYLNGNVGAAETRRVVIPELMYCVKCVNYLTHTDLKLIQRGLKRGQIALEAIK